MKIYPKQIKEKRGAGNYFFGNYGEIPISVSYTVIDQNNLSKGKDYKHFHKKGREFYFTFEGKAILEVEGREVTLDPSCLLMVEPGEKHFVKEILETPLSVLTINLVKNKKDKIKTD